MGFQQNDKVLMIGDSITDCGRREDPEQMGDGYVRLIRDYYWTTQPEKNIEFINKGIGGNRVTDLAARWQEDVIDQQPDWVSISIGINDVWRQLDSPGIVQVYPEEFEKVYDDLLTQVKEKTNAKIILMEPTVIDEDVESKGNQLLVAYVEAVHRLREKYDAVLVPTHEAFIEYLKADTGKKLTTDGVHMNSAGNMLMAVTWIKAMTR